MSTPVPNPAAPGGSDSAGNAWKSLDLTSLPIAAASYTALGLKVIPVHAPVFEDGNIRCTCGRADCIKSAGKHPVHRGWAKQRLGAEDLGSHSDIAEPRNIGWLLGEPSGGIVDVDQDCEEALLLAAAFLPETACVFGRAGRPKSHAVYRITPAIKSAPFKDPNNLMLVEIRSTGIQTVVPPSIHQSGEQIIFYSQGEPTVVDGGLLRRRVSHFAAACLILRYYPRQKGGRWRRVHALAGGLLRAGWPLDQVKEFIYKIASAANDDELDDRMKAVEVTAEKLARGEPVTGWPELGELIGHDNVQLVCKYLDVKPGSSDWECKPSPRTAVAPEERYELAENGLFLKKETLLGPVPVQLTTFCAKIVTDITEDDGVERRRGFEIELWMPGGEPRRVIVPFDEFALMQWPVKHLGAKAIVLPGHSSVSHAAAAIQMTSQNIEARTVYSHTGWVKIGEAWVYLHAGGAIGAEGRDESVQTSLPPALEHFRLPAPPEGEDRTTAIQASLRLLKLGPSAAAYSSVAATVRAVLGGADFTKFGVGETGAFKSEFDSLYMRHFGVGFDARHLPASWTSTANYLEDTAFRLKDAPCVIDDFKPSGDPYSDNQLHRQADRVIRAQGNGAGRGRLNQNLTQRAARPPRGLLFCTGEDVPRGASLRARMCIYELKRGDINSADLTACQRDAASGLYAQTMSAFLKWLAPQLDQVRKQFAARAEHLRAEFKGGHTRQSVMLAELMAAFEIFIEFAIQATDEDALTWVEGSRENDRCHGALEELGKAQQAYQQASSPAPRFIELLVSAVGSGGAHLANPIGERPPDATRWGWRLDTNSGTETWRAMGARIGWVDGDDVYLNLDAAYAAAQDAAGEDRLAVSPTMLTKQLSNAGLLASTDVKDRDSLKVRRSLSGSRRYVLHLKANVLGDAEPEVPL